MKIGLVSKKTDAAEAFSLSLADWLVSCGHKVLNLDKHEPSKDMKLVVVVGGDGTLLHSARLLKGLPIPIIGINMGGLGFLTEINKENAKFAITEFLKGNCPLSERMMCDVSLFRNNKLTIHETVLNDAVVTKGKIARMIEMEAYVNDIKLSHYRADGLIVSTPTGSTAYVLSAGGPIVEPELDCMVICPICPHTLTNRPVVISSTATLSIIIRSKKDVYLTLDGQQAYPLKEDDKIVIKKAEAKTYLVRYKTFFEILKNKMYWGER